MPAPVVSRLISLSYAGLTIGGTSDYHLVGPFRADEDYSSFTVTTQVLVQDNTDATFNTEALALEAAFNTPNGDLTITVNGETYRSYTQAGNTGMNAQPQWKKLGSPADTVNSRLYEVSVSVLLPADESGKNGRRSSSVSVVADGSEIETLSIRAEYTAIGANSALVQARAQFPTYYGSVETLVDSGATWDDPVVTYSFDDENKTCTATYASRELVFNQAQGTLDHPSLQNAQLRVETTREVQPIDPNSGAKPFLRIRAFFTARVPKSSTTDLKTLYDSVVRPHMIDTARTQSGVGSLTVVRELPAPDPVNNSLSAVIDFVASDGSTILDSQTEVQTLERPPETPVPVLDGDPFSVDLHYRPGQRFVVVTGSGWEIGAGEQSLSVFNATVRRYERQGYRVVEEQTLRDKLIEFPGGTGSSSLLTRVHVRRWTGQFMNVRQGQTSRRGNQVGRTRTR